MLLTGPATLRALLDRFGASRIDCEECRCMGLWCDCAEAMAANDLSATGCTPNAAAKGANDETAAGGGRFKSE